MKLIVSIIVALLFVSAASGANFNVQSYAGQLSKLPCMGTNPDVGECQTAAKITENVAMGIDNCATSGANNYTTIDFNVATDGFYSFEVYTSHGWISGVQFILYQDGNFACASPCDNSYLRWVGVEDLVKPPIQRGPLFVPAGNHKIMVTYDPDQRANFPVTDEITGVFEWTGIFSVQIYELGDIFHIAEITGTSPTITMGQPFMGNCIPVDSQQDTPYYSFEYTPTGDETVEFTARAAEKTDDRVTLGTVNFETQTVDSLILRGMRVFESSTWNASCTCTDTPECGTQVTGTWVSPVWTFSLSGGVSYTILIANINAPSGMAISPIRVAIKKSNQSSATPPSDSTTMCGDPRLGQVETLDQPDMVQNEVSFVCKFATGGLFDYWSVEQFTSTTDAYYIWDAVKREDTVNMCPTIDDYAIILYAGLANEPPNNCSTFVFAADAPLGIFLKTGESVTAFITGYQQSGVQLAQYTLIRKSGQSIGCVVEPETPTPPPTTPSPSGSFGVALVPNLFMLALIFVVVFYCS